MAIQGVRYGLRSRAGFNVEIRLAGEWVRVNNILNSIDIDMALAGATAQRKFAEKYRDNVKHNIRTGGKEFGYPGHSPKYRKYKSKHGGPDNRLLHWSGAMEEAVQVVKLGGGRLGVGIKKGIKRERYDNEKGDILDISEYANILEKGAYSRGIPARPVFADTFKEDMGGIRGLKTYLAWHVARNLKAKGVPVIKI